MLSSGIPTHCENLYSMDDELRLNCQHLVACTLNQRVLVNWVPFQNIFEKVVGLQ